MLLREVVLEIFLVSFTTSGEMCQRTGTRSPLLGPRWMAPCLLAPERAVPERLSALQELHACQARPE